MLTDQAECRADIQNDSIQFVPGTKAAQLVSMWVQDPWKQNHILCQLLVRQCCCVCVPKSSSMCMYITVEKHTCFRNKPLENWIFMLVIFWKLKKGKGTKGNQWYLALSDGSSGSFQKCEPNQLVPWWILCNNNLIAIFCMVVTCLNTSKLTVLGMLWWLLCWIHRIVTKSLRMNA